MKKQLFCPNCGQVVEDPKMRVNGSFLIELVLWFCLLIPGLIYSIWRYTSQTPMCPDCKNDALIPADSPRAVKMLTDLKT